VSLLVIAAAMQGQIPQEYKGKAFEDATHRGGTQSIPGRLQAELYDLGGEGVAYHDVDSINHGSGELNHQKGHCEEGVPDTICHFCEHEGVDISWTWRKRAFIR
jgi:hypothetical protein